MTKTIGIDARFWGLEHAGIGRYVMELIEGLQKLDKKNKYILFLRKKYKNFLTPPSNFKVVVADVDHYSVAEQWLALEIFLKHQLDLLHIPHFNVPVFYKRPFVVTIHDLLWHEVRGMSVTTQNPLVYLVKYGGYRLVVKNALLKSKSIFVPSRTIKDKLVKDHKISEEKIKVTYEAPSHAFRIKKTDTSVLKKYAVKTPYLIYTGSAYPHKNIISAVKAVKNLNYKSQKKIELLIVSSRSIFLENLLQEIQDIGASEFVKILGFVADRDLAQLYRNSLALIQPSLSEGFGLTGLEAMASGTAVLASDIEIFREIYGQAALYFNPKSVEDIAKKIEKISKMHIKRKELLKLGKKQLANFSWEKLIKETHEVYTASLK